MWLDTVSNESLYNSLVIIWSTPRCLLCEHKVTHVDPWQLQVFLFLTCSTAWLLGNPDSRF